MFDGNERVTYTVTNEGRITLVDKLGNMSEVEIDPNAPIVSGYGNGKKIKVVIKGEHTIVKDGYGNTEIQLDNDGVAENDGYEIRVYYGDNSKYALASLTEYKTGPNVISVKYDTDDNNKAIIKIQSSVIGIASATGYTSTEDTTGSLLTQTGNATSTAIQTYSVDKTIKFVKFVDASLKE